MMDESLKNKYRSNDSSNHRKQFSDIIKSLLDVYSLCYTIDFFLSLLHFTPLSSPKPQPWCCLACQPTALTSSHELLTSRSPLIGRVAINNSSEVLAEKRREGKQGGCSCWEFGPQYGSMREHEMLQLEPPRQLPCAGCKKNEVQRDETCPGEWERLLEVWPTTCRQCSQHAKHMAPCLELAMWGDRGMVQSSAMSLCPTCVPRAPRTSPTAHPICGFAPCEWPRSSAGWACGSEAVVLIAPPDSAFRAPKTN